MSAKRLGFNVNVYAPTRDPDSLRVLSNANTSIVGLYVTPDATVDAQDIARWTRGAVGLVLLVGPDAAGGRVVSAHAAVRMPDGFTRLLRDHAPHAVAYGLCFVGPDLTERHTEWIGHQLQRATARRGGYRAHEYFAEPNLDEAAKSEAWDALDTLGGMLGLMGDAFRWPATEVLA